MKVKNNKDYPSNNQRRTTMVSKQVVITFSLNSYIYEQHRKIRFATIGKEIAKLSGILHVTFNDVKLAPLEIKYFNTRRRRTVPIDLEGGKKRRVYRDHHLTFKSKFAVPIDNWQPGSNDFNEFEYFCKCYIRHLLIYINIARPGAIHAGGGKMVVTEKIGAEKRKTAEDLPSIISLTQEALYLHQELQWPPLKDLPIRNVIDWLGKHWKAFELKARNNIERALNAYSYLFHESLVDQTASDLFYAILGIEAMFVSGRDGIQKQVDTKTQMLFGERKQFKKRFNEMYDFRSRYVHGQLNLTNKFHVDDFNEEIQNSHLQPLYDNSCFALLILIAGIQKHFELDSDELVFELKLKK